MKYKVEKKDKTLLGEINLSTSKSISNRLLIIKALCNKEISIKNLSISEDTKIIEKALVNNGPAIDAGHAGTAMRFLTAYFAQKKGEWILTGSERMKNRPINFLVDGLRQLGADIEYLEKDGYPPLKINGKKLSGNYVKIDGSISSQFITAILLIAPTLQSDLILELYNKTGSIPYIKLTLELMSYFGINYTWEDNIITIPNQEYSPNEITVEADWSGASYWYEMASFANQVDLKIYGLYQNSLQGDAIVSRIYERLGIKTLYIENGIHLTKLDNAVDYFEFDFSDYPDLIQTVVPTCVIKNIPFKLSGAESLKIKETDRIFALQQEIAKFGAEIKETGHGTIEWDGKIVSKLDYNIEIDTYVDHRMAMAFAPIAIDKKNLIINDPGVVVKSYPSYWKDLIKAGFEVKEL